MKNMKLARIPALLRGYFTLGASINTTTYPSMSGPLPPNMTADNSALFGIIGFANNQNIILDPELQAIPTTASATITMTAAQFYGTIIDVASTNGSGIALTTPTAAQIIQGAPPTAPKNGFNWIHRVLNDNTGQTITYTAGANVTLAATTATIATNTARDFFINVNINAGTVNIVAIGGGLTM